MSEAGDKVRETMRQMGELADLEDKKKEKEDEIRRLGEEQKAFLQILMFYPSMRK